MRGPGGIAGALRPPWKAGQTEDDPDPGGRPGGLRKKGWVGVRAWLAVDALGQTEVVEAGKHAIMRRTELPARDLRILDPMLSYPPTVLGREHAIVINLEHIKAIITAKELLLLNFREPFVAPFVLELQLHLHRRLATADHSNDQRGTLGGGDANWDNVYDVEELHSRTASPAPNDTTSFGGTQERDNHGKADVKPGSANLVGPNTLPFELIALEACLEAACSFLENETRILEQEAHSALDKLTSKVSTLNLECVRQVKSRLVAITGRVQKVRDELEHLLDDDADMAEMYLTEKLLQQQEKLLQQQEKFSDGSSGRSSSNVKGDEIDGERVRCHISLEKNDIHNSYEDDLQNIDNKHHELSGKNMLKGDSHSTRSHSTCSGSKHLDVEDLEMLLEAYFVQVDGILNKLSTLREYVDDTEDYINIMLDDKQNHLLQMGVKLTTATLVVSTFVVLVGIFGMNIDVELFDLNKSGMPEFLWIIGGGATGSLFLYVIAIAWCKHRRFLE